EPGLDGEDLGALLDGIDAPEPAAAPTPQPAPRPTPAFEAPRTGQGLYKWACNAKCLPRVNALGKRHGWPRLVTQWSADPVADAYAKLTAAASTANGRH